MGERRFATREAFRELMELVKEGDAEFLSGPRAVDDVSALEGYRWLTEVLAVALDCHLWADPARPHFVPLVGPTRKFGGDNSDAMYCFAPLDPGRSYRVRGRRGDACYLSLTVYGGPRDGRWSDRVVGTLNDRDMEIDADGRFEVLLGPEERPGNFLRLDPDSVCLVTRDYLVHPRQGRFATWEIEALGPAPPPPRITDADLAARFRATATFLRDMFRITPLPFDPAKANTIDEPYPVPERTYGWAAADAAYAMGSFDLPPGRALVVEGRSPECAFWNLCLWNPFLQTYDYRYEPVTLNDGQIRYEPDGSWRVVVAERDPGVPNWVSTAGHRRGRIWLRWFLPEAQPERPRTRVVAWEDLAREGSGSG